MSFKGRTFFSLLLLFAVIGFLQTLRYAPLQIILTGAIAAILVFALNKFLTVAKTGGKSKPLRRAKPVKAPPKKQRRKRKDFPFRVIEGNKGKQPEPRKTENYH
ncbi:hypothetical protein BSNK01_06460 [Bacillaceae bacterium]